LVEHFERCPLGKKPTLPLLAEEALGLERALLLERFAQVTLLDFEGLIQDLGVQSVGRATLLIEVEAELLSFQRDDQSMCLRLEAGRQLVLI